MQRSESPSTIRLDASDRSRTIHAESVHMVESMLTWTAAMLVEVRQIHPAE